MYQIRRMIGASVTPPAVTGKEKAGVAPAPCGWIGVRSNSVPIEVQPRLGSGI
jgi:hypothetical protein